MGPFRRFKGKFRPGTIIPKKVVPEKEKDENNVVCIKFHTYSEFDTPIDLSATTSKYVVKPEVIKNQTPNVRDFVPTSKNTRDVKTRTDITTSREQINTENNSNSNSIEFKKVVPKPKSEPPPKPAEIIEISKVSEKTETKHDKKPNNNKPKVAPAVPPVKQSPEIRHDSKKEPVNIKPALKKTSPVPKIPDTKPPATKEMFQDFENIYGPMSEISDINFPDTEARKHVVTFSTVGYNDDDEEEIGNFPIHIANHSAVQSMYQIDSPDHSETESESEIEEPSTPIQFSSQAASIFFGDDDDDEPVVERPRNININDGDSSDGSSADC